MLLKSLTLFLVMGASIACAAAPPATARWIHGKETQETDLSTVLGSVQPGDVVVIGEQHANAPCQEQQLLVLQGLRQRGLKVSVGMEFLEVPFQAQTDLFRRGGLSETDFLKEVGWGSFAFELYRGQILFPNSSEGATTLALNAPRAITGKVAKLGIESLTDEDKQWLPPDLTRGNAGYHQRFSESMPHLPGGSEANERYFWAQSIWDDTMAWNASNFIKANPEQVLVIIVGEFHVQYGGGLPDRLRARGVNRVMTISELDLTGLTEAEQNAELVPHPSYGPRADWIWAF